MIREIVVEQYVCDRCSCSWLPRNQKLPKVCPRCKSRDWNSKPVEDINDNISNTKPNDAARLLGGKIECPKCKESQYHFNLGVCLKCGYRSNTDAQIVNLKVTDTRAIFKDSDESGFEEQVIVPFEET